MAGGHMKYRHLHRTSAHRQALLRNLVTSLFEHESISTTWHKAKEAQRLAEQLVTLGKRNTEASRRRAHQIFYKPLELVPKLFGEIRERYAARPGGYTRVLRIEPLKEDQAPSALLELVDGPKDMRFAMTARAIARQRSQPPAASPSPSSDNAPPHEPGLTDGLNDITRANVAKVTRYRAGGRAALAALVGRFRTLEVVRVPAPADEDVTKEEYRQKQLRHDRHFGFSTVERDREAAEEKKRRGWAPGRWVEREPTQRWVYPTEFRQKTWKKTSRLKRLYQKEDIAAVRAARQVMR